MRLGNVFPHSSCLIKPLYFNVNSTVDQGWRLLNSQIDAVLETKLLVGIIEIGDGCVVFFLVFNGILTILFGWIEKKMDYFRV